MFQTGNSIYLSLNQSTTPHYAVLLDQFFFCQEMSLPNGLCQTLVAAEKLLGSVEGFPCVILHYFVVVVVVCILLCLFCLESKNIQN